MKFHFRSYIYDYQKSSSLAKVPIRFERIGTLASENDQKYKCKRSFKSLWSGLDDLNKLSSIIILRNQQNFFKNNFEKK